MVTILGSAWDQGELLVMSASLLWVVVARYTHTTTTNECCFCLFLGFLCSTYRIKPVHGLSAEEVGKKYCNQLVPTGLKWG